MVKTNKIEIVFMDLLHVITKHKHVSGGFVLVFNNVT